MDLLDLPSELLLAVLGECHPAALAPLSASCRTLRQIIKGNHLLHKAVYLGVWDEPPSEIADARDTDWVSKVHELIFLQTIMASPRTTQKTKHWPRCADTILSLLRNSTGDSWTDSGNAIFLAGLFRDRRNVKFFLCESSLFRPGPCQNVQELEHCQASAKMHVLYGVPVEEFPRGRSEEATNPLARARVYDLRNYTSQTFWGPFRDDGSAQVDWEMMESIMIVLGFNLKRFHLRTHGRFPLWWNLPFDGAHPRSFADSPMKPVLEDADTEVEPSEEEREENLKRKLAAKDPYGVTGIWMRVVSFLDYDDLFAYNFMGPDPGRGQPREPNTSDEAIRLLSMRIHVAKIEPPGPHDGQALPVVHFAGVCDSLHRGWDHNSNSDLTGTVRLTPEGEVRWTSLSVFDGDERWKSEGIQVGGVGSARGVLGTWFDKSYDGEGPAGPTAFWKLSSDEFDDEPPLPPRIAAQKMPPYDDQANAFLSDFRSRNFDHTNRFDEDDDEEEEDEEEEDEEEEEEEDEDEEDEECIPHDTNLEVEISNQPGAAQTVDELDQ